GGAEDHARARRLGARDRHGHAAILERARRVQPLELEIELEPRPDALRERGGGDQRRVPFEQRHDRRLGNGGQDVPELAQEPAPGAQMSKIRTARGFFRMAGSDAIAWTASRTSLSRASWVSIVMEDSPRTPGSWNICATLTPAPPSRCATCASTPGRSSTMSRR